MNRQIIFIAALMLGALACSLTYGTQTINKVTTIAQATLQPTQNTGALIANNAITIQPPTQAPSCSVATGTEGGQLTLRACAAVTCAALDYLAEGYHFQPTKKSGNWFYIANLGGWVNSNYATCEG